jgi:hypothetical protein
MQGPALGQPAALRFELSIKPHSFQIDCASWEPPEERACTHINLTPRSRGIGEGGGRGGEIL